MKKNFENCIFKIEKLLENIDTRDILINKNERISKLFSITEKLLKNEEMERFKSLFNQ